METAEAAQTNNSGAAVENVQINKTAPVPNETHRKLQMPSLKTLKKSPCRTVCLSILFVLLSILGIVVSVAIIVVTVLASIATKVYDAEQSNRLVAMVVLAVTGAVTISIAIYAVIAVFKKHTKPLHTAAIVLVILAVIQALIAGLSVNVTATDELNLGRSLADSFKLAKEDNPRHVKLWATTQTDLQCCGLYGPEDYRARNLPPYFSPNVPITCCPTYDSDRSELVQEREREICKARKSFYDIGCKNLVIEVFKETGAVVLGVTICLIVLELLMSLTGAVLTKRNKSKKGIESENEKQQG